jgi:hypothetical protein
MYVYERIVIAFRAVPTTDNLGKITNRITVGIGAIAVAIIPVRWWQSPTNTAHAKGVPFTVAMPFSCNTPW